MCHNRKAVSSGFCMTFYIMLPFLLKQFIYYVFISRHRFENFIMRGFMIFTRHQVLYGIKSQRMGWVGHVVRIGEKRNDYRILDGKPEGKKPLGRPGHRWEDNIKMDIKCDEKD